jgi:hypothetical protein
MLKNYMTQVGQLLLSKCTLLEFDMHLVVLENLKYNSQMINVFLQCFTKN